MMAKTGVAITILPTMLNTRDQRKALAKLATATRSRCRRETPINMGVNTLTEGDETGHEHGPEAVTIQQSEALGGGSFRDHPLHMAHERCHAVPALPVGEHAPYPGRKRQMSKVTSAPAPHAHQTARQQHQAVTGQGQKDEARFRKRITTRQVTSRPIACICIS